MTGPLGAAFLSFQSPRNLIALAVVPALLAFAFLVRRLRSRYSVAFTNLPVLRALGAERGDWRRLVPLFLLSLAFVTIALALARPHIQLTKTDDSATIVLLVDVSGSMAAVDIHPTRMAAAVAAMHQLVFELPKADKVGLVAFSDKVNVLDQPTTDHDAVDSGLAVLTPQGGTALGTAVVTSVKVILSSLAAEGVHHTPGSYLPAAIVLESDGKGNRGQISTYNAAEFAKQAGVRVYGVALGTKKGTISAGGGGLLAPTFPVPPDPGTVALLARESGGQAYDATTADQLNQVYRRLGTTVQSRRRPVEITSWFEGAAAVLFAGAVATARLRGAALP
jgi:Ca-activated chloride channel homolog